MFAIYGVSGQMFKGPLEELRKVGPTLRSARVRAIEPERARLESPDAGVPAAGARSGGAGSLQQQALSEYARVQSPVPERHPLSRVADVMNDQVVLISDTATVGEGWQLLASQGVGQAPVINADGRLVGLLTRADLLRPDRLPGLPVVDEAGQVSGFVSRSDILRAVVHDPPLDLWS